MKLIFIKNIKNLLLIYLTIFLLSFSLVIAQDNTGLLSMADQGKIRTCLTATADNVDQNGWKNVNGTIKLNGQCLSESGCEIWQCNSDNKEIAEDEALLQKCKTNSQLAGCSNPEKIKEDQQGILDRLFKINEKLYKAYVLRAEFRQIFAGTTVRSRLIRLTNWIKRAKAVHISQITEYVKKIERWEPYIRNSLRCNCSNSFAEGINTKIRVIQRMAYGYKDFDYLRLKIFQQFNFREIKSLFDG